MPRPAPIHLCALAGLALALTTIRPAGAETDGPRLGRPLDEAAIPFYARHVMPDGGGLPPGRGTVAEGKAVYQAACAFCHGATGTEGPVAAVAGPSAANPKPAGRHWPYAPTLFDYIRRAMPYHAPKSLSDDEVYAVTAYILHESGVIGADATLDAARLAAVEMPNRDRVIDLWARQGDTPY